MEDAEPDAPGGVRLPGGKAFTVTAKNNGPFNPYVQSRTLDGRPLQGEHLDYATVMKGGDLSVELANRPPADARP